MLVCVLMIVLFVCLTGSAGAQSTSNSMATGSRVPQALETQVKVRQVDSSQTMIANQMFNQSVADTSIRSIKLTLDPVNSTELTSPRIRPLTENQTGGPVSADRQVTLKPIWTVPAAICHRPLWFRATQQFVRSGAYFFLKSARFLTAVKPGRSYPDSGTILFCLSFLLLL